MTNASFILDVGIFLNINQLVFLGSIQDTFLCHFDHKPVVLHNSICSFWTAKHQSVAIYIPGHLLPFFADRHSCPLPPECLLDYTETTCCPHVERRHVSVELLDETDTGHSHRFVFCSSEGHNYPPQDLY